jgi:hypothetical protein
MGREVVVDFSSDKGRDQITCKFEIKYSTGEHELKECVSECIAWMDSIGYKNSPDFNMKNGKEKFELTIKGRGHDGRCQKCRQFRTRLKNLLFGKRFVLKYSGSCIFEGGGGDDIDQQKKIEDRKTKLRLGLIEDDIADE